VPTQNIQSESEEIMSNRFINVVLKNSNLNLAPPYSKFCARGWEYDLRVCGDQERVEARS
jgi:hypothetical protein